MLGLQLYNSMCCVDFLESLDFVDRTRIGCTGASGGGTQTFLLAAIDKRIAAAAPVNMVSHRMQGGCECESAPGLRFGTNNVEIAALMAPRPLMLTGCTGDWTHDLPNCEYPAVHAIYDLYDAGNQVEYFYCDAPHNYNQPTREAVVSWFIRQFTSERETVPYREKPFEIAVEQLHALRNGLPDGALSCGEIMQHLKESKHEKAIQIIQTEPETIRHALGYLFGIGQMGHQIACFDEKKEQSWAQFYLGSERGERIPVRMTGCKTDCFSNLTVLIVVKEASDSAFFASAKTEWLESADVILCVDPFLTGTYQNPYYAVGRNLESGWETPAEEADRAGLLCFHRTDTAIRVCDILSVIAYCKNMGASKIGLIGMQRRATDAAATLALTDAIDFAWLEGKFVPETGVPDAFSGFCQPGLEGIGGFAALRALWRAAVKII